MLSAEVRVLCASTVEPASLSQAVAVDDGRRPSSGGRHSPASSAAPTSKKATAAGAGPVRGGRQLRSLLGAILADSRTSLFRLTRRAQVYVADCAELCWGMTGS